MSWPPPGASTSSSAAEWPPPPSVPSAYVPDGSVSIQLTTSFNITGTWYSESGSGSGVAHAWMSRTRASLAGRRARGPAAASTESSVLRRAAFSMVGRQGRQRPTLLVLPTNQRLVRWLVALAVLEFSICRAPPRVHAAAVAAVAAAAVAAATAAFAAAHAPSRCHGLQAAPGYRRRCAFLSSAEAVSCCRPRPQRQKTSPPPLIAG
eukprot:scaffold8936_cov61-Phaeocystis_antarctica.AAC.15